MIDMHCHMLYGVDDGARTMEEAIAMLQEAKSQGVDGIILTPHYRHGMFSYPREMIEAHFAKLKEVAQKLSISLYLGTEYHVNSNMLEAFKSGKCHTLADSRYILTEYSYHSEYTYIRKMTQEAIMHGYLPIIAHVERYGCLREDMDCIAELQEMGAWIQVNADAIIGLEGIGTKRFCKQLLKNGWMDIVASDCHGIKERACHMQKCFTYISKKYSMDYAKELMCDTPALILQ